MNFWPLRHRRRKTLRLNGEVVKPVSVRDLWQWYKRAAYYKYNNHTLADYYDAQMGFVSRWIVRGIIYYHTRG